MPSTEKTDKSELTGVVDLFLSKKRIEKGDTTTNAETLSIIEFIDQFKLLPDGLFPVQKFILKLYYNIPLDGVLPEDERHRIRITDRFNTKIIAELTEVQYLSYLYEQGRCNIKEQDERERKELILCLGRRSGKSALASIIMAYELYKLLRKGHPQQYYGMPPSAEIRVLCIANDKEQAGIVYQDIANYTTVVDYFKSSITHNTQTFQKFQTEFDKEKFGEGKRGTITATFKSSIARGLRGRGVICMVLDELAFFVNEGHSSAEQVYRALMPSIAQFSPKNPRNKHEAVGPTDGRVISISSPDARDGFFYKLYQISLSGGRESSNMLMIQAPTWEVNPTLYRDYYEVEYAKDPKSFETEHGAQFSDRVRGWIEDATDLTECIDPNLKPYIRGNPREPFWCGVDFGITKDGTSVVLTHIKNKKIEMAYHEIWYAKRSWKDINPHLQSPLIPYANTLHSVQRLDVDEIINWLVALSKRFYIYKGVFDQWSGPIFEQKLHKAGLTQFEMRTFMPSDSSQCYSTAKMLMYSRQLSLYDYPIPGGISSGSKIHSPHITELLELQATSNGKNIINVEAPNIPGKHDDFSDGFVRSCMLATEYIRENPSVLSYDSFISSIGDQYMPRESYFSYHRRRNRLHGGVPRERQIPNRRTGSR